MAEQTNSDVERKIITILRILSESHKPLGSVTMSRELEHYGYFLTERTIRYHLRITDERGYTASLGRGGRRITQKGIEELESALAPEQIGFMLDKIGLIAFQTTFDPEKQTGQIPINTSLIDKKEFKRALSVMKGVFKARMCVSDLVATASEGEKLGDVVVPKGKIGLATVSSVVTNGVLLKAGIPVDSRFGGVLEIVNSKPTRFVAVINYSGTSIDPTEQYIRAKMTRINEAVKTGNGRILANFREAPGPSRALIEEKINTLREVGINGVYILGNISKAICQIPVGVNRIGFVLLGGLNPVAAAVESGIEIENVGESGVIDFSQLTSFWQL